MNQTKRFCFLLLFSNLFLLSVKSQSIIINGNVKNSLSKENASAISVTVKGAQNGTFTNSGTIYNPIENPDCGTGTITGTITGLGSIIDACGPT